MVINILRRKNHTAREIEWNMLIALQGVGRKKAIQKRLAEQIKI